MVSQTTSTEVLRERLTGLLADWGAEMSMLLKELDAARAEAAAVKAGTQGRADRLRQLEERAKAQSELIETLKAEAAEAGGFREEIRERDLEIERLNSEIESKQELVRALRRDAETVDRLKSEARQKDKQIADQAAALKEVEERLAELEGLAESETAEDHAELAAVKAELEARKSLIKSLRADSERVATLEAQLEAKREIVASLEASVNQHAETIAEVRKTAEQWKRKYLAAKGADDTSSASLPAFSETEVEAMKALEKAGGEPERTLAIDMRRPLSEARRKMAERS